MNTFSLTLFNIYCRNHLCILQNNLGWGWSLKKDNMYSSSKIHYGNRHLPYTHLNKFYNVFNLLGTLKSIWSKQVVLTYSSKAFLGSIDKVVVEKMFAIVKLQFTFIFVRGIDVISNGYLVRLLNYERPVPIENFVAKAMELIPIKNNWNYFIY